MNNLAGTLWAQGDLASARALQEEVLTVSRRILGAEHSDTLTIMSNLATTLEAQGNLPNARALQEEVLTVRI
jgi:Flp pilus assembly protein TadD